MGEGIELSGRSNGRVLEKPTRLVCTQGVMFVRQGLAKVVLQAGDAYDALAGLVSLTNMGTPRDIPARYRWEADPESSP